MLLIIGRTATGKDALQNILTDDYSWKAVKSFTTRQRRNKTEDTHVFVTKNEANRISEEEKAARTVINENEYFATKEQVRNCDVYIIDPQGAYMLIDNMPDEIFDIVYMHTNDQNKRKEMAVNRSKNKKKEEKILQKRMDDEEAQFVEFEHLLSAGLPYKNIRKIINFANTYDKKDLKRLAKKLNECKKHEEKLYG